MPLKASNEAVPATQSQTVAIAAAKSPAMEMPPVIQRCEGRVNASTSITITAAAQTITSGAISDQLITGIVDCARNRFIHSCVRGWQFRSSHQPAIASRALESNPRPPSNDRETGADKHP